MIVPMLDERAITPRISRSISPCSNASLIVPPPDSSRDGMVSLVSGSATPASIRAAAVSNFWTLPGSYAAETARLPRSSGSASPGLDES
jgi:hypothetical protein